MIYNTLFTAVIFRRNLQLQAGFSVRFKGALDKYNIIIQLFPKKSWDFHTIRSVSMGNDCMLSFTF